MAQFALGDRWALVPSEGADPIGMSRKKLRQAARRADLLLSVSGMLLDPDVLDAVSVRAYLDLDPAFNQLWQASRGVDMRFGSHTHFVTVAMRRRARVPDSGLRPRMAPDRSTRRAREWPCAERTVERRASQRSATGAATGRSGTRASTTARRFTRLRPLLTCPRAPRSLEPALAIHPDEEKDLVGLPRTAGSSSSAGGRGDARRYRSFVQGSRAELGIAKLGYAVSGSGWFSDRSACYLASGRPVIAQETGFARLLPSVRAAPVRVADDIVAAVEDLERDYGRHRAAARDIAVEHLDSDRVLTRLLERLL